MSERKRVTPAPKRFGAADGSRADAGERRRAPRRSPLRLATGCCTALLGFLLLQGCQQPEPPTPKHVILVTVDTLRADYIGAYGGDVETPFFDRLAQEGTLIEEASAHVPLTRPSHVSLFTGLLPFETGVRDNLTPAKIPPVPLLAEVFQKAGFRTAAFVSSVVVAAPSGLDRGFDIYSDDFSASPEDPDFLQSAQKRGDETVEEAIAWLQTQAKKDTGSDRIFLWLHLYDPHEPYEAPQPYAADYPDRPYAAEVAWSDELLRRLESALDQLGLDNDCLWAVTSDHGEGLGDHGEQLHGFFAYQSTLRVPLLFRGPGVTAGGRLGKVAGLVDLYPTLLDLAGLAPPENNPISGRSLASAIRQGRDSGEENASESPHHPLYAETLVPKLHFGWSDLRVVRQGNWKLIEAPQPELYDLATDPGERENLFTQERRQGHALRQYLDEFLSRETEASTSLAGETGTEMSQETRDQLAALGYVSAGGSAVTDSPGADPKDKVEEFRRANALIRDGVRHLNDESFEAAEKNFRELIELGIESPEILRHWGRSQLALGQTENAAATFRRWLAAAPTDPAAWQSLSEAELQLGNPQAALTTLRDAQLALPENLPLKRRLGVLLRRFGLLAEARQVLQEALSQASDDAHLRAVLGETLRDLGRAPEALEQLKRATELDPKQASYWNALGLTLGGSNRLPEAQRAFEEACQLEADNSRYAFNLGLALRRLGQFPAARRHMERALSLDPGFEAARLELTTLPKSSAAAP